MPPKSNKARKRRDRRKTRAAPRAQHQAVLSPCADLYLKARTQPFSAYDQLPCYPDLVSLPSQKIKIWQRGVLSTGLTGDGFILVGAHNPTSDGDVVLRTQSSSVGNVTTTPDAYTNTITRSWVGARSTVAELSVDTSGFRAVAIGLRARYTGPALYRAGIVYGGSSPTAEDLGTLSLQAAGDMLHATRVPISDKWHTVMWMPVTTGDLAYRDTPLSDHTLALYFEGTYTGAGVVGPASFMWEVVGFYELIGSQSGLNTTSESDPVGLAAVKNVVDRTNHVDGAPSYESAKRRALNDVVGMATHIGVGLASESLRRRQQMTR